MKDSTKYIIDNKERFNNEIEDYVGFITFDEDSVNRRKKN